MPEPKRADAFVGRTAALAEFADAIQAALAQLPSAALVGGDAGVGGAIAALSPPCSIGGAACGQDEPEDTW